MRIEQLHQLREICQRAGQPIYFIDDYDAHPFGRDIGQQSLQRRPICIPAREPAIVVTRLQHLPALRLLPRQAAWLDAYVLELTTFNRGKFDDQVDSTSQALGWLAVNLIEPGIITYYRMLAQQQNRGNI